jgi:hypothetical protein
MTLTYDDGRALAVELLETLENGDNVSFTLAAEYHPGREQDNILARYIRTIKDNPDLIEGFGAVLTDYIAACAGGGIPDASDYECE